MAPKKNKTPKPQLTEEEKQKLQEEKLKRQEKREENEEAELMRRLQELWYNTDDEIYLFRSAYNNFLF